MGTLLPPRFIDTAGADATNDTLRYNPATDRVEYQPVGSGVLSIVPGSGVSVDNTDPAHPVVSATGGSGGGGNLATVFYNPAASASKSITGTTLTDVDATNLAVTFVAPSSGTVLVRVNAAMKYPGSGGAFWGLRSGSSTVLEAYIGGYGTGAMDLRQSVVFPVTGLTPGTSYTYKFAARTDGPATTMSVAVGGGNAPVTMEVLPA